MLAVLTDTALLPPYATPRPRRLFVFEFVNNFISLFYLAFAQR